MKKLFVWDFHGTLEKGNERAVLEYVNMVLVQRGEAKRISYEECKALYGKKLWEFFQSLFPDRSKQECMELQQDFLVAEHQHPEILMSYIRPNDGMMDVLDAISNSTHEQLLLSNTEISMLLPFIQSVGIEKYFPDGRRFATNAHEGQQTTKRNLLDDFVVGRSFDHIVAVGDSPHDLSLAEGLDATTYLYAHPGWDFRDYDATYCIRDLREILREI